MVSKSPTQSTADQGEDPTRRITLGMLTAIEEDSGLSQRRLAGRLGIALGLTNSYLKRCVRKGLVKVRAAPANRYLYYLTPKGFAEKSRLTREFLTWSFQYYRLARKEIDGIFSELAQKGWSRVALGGAGELAEIAVLCAMAHSVTIVGLIDEDEAAARALGLSLLDGAALPPDLEAVLITDLAQAQTRYDALVRTLGPSRVFALSLLNITKAPAAES